MDEQSIESLLERLQCSRYIEDGVTGKRTDGIRRTLRTLVAQYEDDQIIGAISTGTAPGFIDALLQHLRREHSSKSHLSAHLTKLMLRAAHVTACLPPSLFISGVSITDLNLVYGGGFADIYQGEYEGHLVAVRCLRFFTNQSRKRRAEVERVLYREALLWRSLNHPRLLELYGIDQQVRPPLLCMISPWMDQGNMNQYIDHYQPPRSTIFRLLCEVAEGLAYIHGRHLVHGDLRGANILINDDHEAVLADFGLARVTDVTRSTSRNAGAVRWMAPELHDPTLAEGADRRSADVYSFAMLWVEVWTEYPPFESISKEGQVILTVMAGNRPDRPRHESHGYLTDCLWELVQACWHQEPQWRPAIRDVWAWLHGYINNTYLLYHPLFSSAGISQRSQSLLKTTALPPVPSRSLSRSGHYRVGKNSRRLLGPCYLDARRDGLKAPVFSSQKVRLALSRGMRHAKPIGMASPVELEIWKGIRHPNVACPIGFAYWNSEVYMVRSM
ncbi:kinase-like protein [Neolentinus lepideus HHB14362 ss-1]|uniref:Kinase-like protein n=1 Tax=Neolentinus lepideus HHB14362 ss-1 TaxID=1314782 RepID=A0A165MTM0_9AGAM|nr:kinase-like protein [Neolentinus lepideus HHB14362 ss-1]